MVAFCTGCGTSLPADSRFCTSCGTSVPATMLAAPEPARYAPQPERPPVTVYEERPARLYAEPPPPVPAVQHNTNVQVNLGGLMLGRTRISFDGHFFEFAMLFVGLAILTIVTFGLAAPFMIFYLYKYFFTKMRVGDRNVAFTGNFVEYYLVSLGLGIASVVTFGLVAPYWAYWNIKYFFSHLAVE